MKLRNQKACDRIGSGKYHRSGIAYDRLRAHAMRLLLRHTSLRISDIAALRKDAFSWDQTVSTWRVFVRSEKTGDLVCLPIPEDLKQILDALPLPRGAAPDCPYYFWNGQTSRRAAVEIAERSMAAVFPKNPKLRKPALTATAIPRLRVWLHGAPFRLSRRISSAALCGPGTMRKWSKGGQENIDWLIVAHF